ncbi:MAG: NifB/NifX family molybdenum-iron cluster-binding protein [Oscillospiraceae bacterium]|nr:NifB/NifX family molybdenum-iron cluster-binding protein [Oscillospiraceae bacterium]
MRIAVTYENGQIFGHFGRTEQFAVYDVVDGKINGMKVIGTDGAGHGALAGFLKNAGADVLICGGIGEGAQTAVKAAGIRLLGGNTGSADDAVKAFLAGALPENDAPVCSHHSHEHGHGQCGVHKCGEH